MFLLSTTILNETVDQKAVVNQDDIARDNDDNNEGQSEIPRRSTRNKKTLERNDFITGNWWEVDKALYSCVDDAMGEPRTVQKALESPDKSK